MSPQFLGLQFIQRIKLAVCFLVALLTLGACGSAVVNPATIQTADAIAARSNSAEYMLQPGDELDVRFYYNPELNLSVLVRPDGKISLPLADDVQAAGLSPAALTQALRNKYERELRRPEITVIVRSFNSQKVFVGGDVAAPGVIQVVGPMTVLQSVTQAGGFRETAQINEVLVIRRNLTAPSSGPVVIPVDISAAIDGSKPTQDIALVPYDIVYVPKSPIANVNKFVDQYLQNIPFGFGLTYGIGSF